MGNSRRIKKGKQRGMHKQRKNGKAPMSEERKLEKRKTSEADRERTKADLEKKLKAKKVVKKE